MLLHEWSVAAEVGAEGRFPNRSYGNDGWERYAALGMTRRGDSVIGLIRFWGFVPGS